MKERERVGIVVIGAGQVGLSVGYHLKQRGLPFVILEANARVGDTWRRRWDSLRLFTAARFDGLVGMPFPKSRHEYPTKNEMADYLESYADRFQLPVRTGVTVERVARHGRRYLLTTGDREIEAEHVVVAMASYQRPRTPAFASEIDQRVVQLHSIDYRNLSQLREGGVLVVGAGNSGAEIAREASHAGHQTWLSGRMTGQVPFRIEGFLWRNFVGPLVLRFVFHRVLSLSTPMGRRARPRMIGKGSPLIRLRETDLIAAGVERVAKTAGVRGGKPLLADGRTLDVTNVIWCTGFHPGFDWIDLPVFGEDGEPLQERGVVTGEPGLYFVGLHFLYAFSSTMIHGADRDTSYIADAIASRVGAEVGARGSEAAEDQAEAATADVRG